MDARRRASDSLGGEIGDADTRRDRSDAVEATKERGLPSGQTFGPEAEGLGKLSGIIAVRAPVAQWIERRPPEPKVAGSNPVGRATLCIHAGREGLTPTGVWR